MRIISKFQDYYDCGLSYGIDPNLVYERKTHEHREDVNGVKATRRANDRLLRTVNKSGEYSTDQTFVYQSFLHFCGKAYPFYHVKYYRDKKDSFEREYHEIFFWNNDQCGDKLPEKNGYWKREYDYSKEWTPVESTAINQRFNSPIVIEQYPDFKTVKYTVSPCLKDYGFSSVIDPYTAFQEVSMFMAMLQNPEDAQANPLPTDDEKVVSHGMDPEYGFRKMPQK